MMNRLADIPIDAGAGQTVQDVALPSLVRSLLTGGLGFGLVSLCVFATVAFGERWMYEHLGLLGAYLAWTALFILLGGGVLGSLVVGRWRLPRFYLLWHSSHTLPDGSAHISIFVGALANGSVPWQALS